MTLKYGLADFDRNTGTVDWNINLPMDGVKAGVSLYEFMDSAALNGWELCASFPSGHKGSKRAVPGKAETIECQDPSEIITFIFKHS